MKQFVHRRTRTTHSLMVFHGDQESVAGDSLEDGITIQRFHPTHVQHGGIERLAGFQCRRGEGAEGQPVVKVGGLPWEAVTTNADSLLRPKEQDLFR
mgnify:CR=1 FL=1